MSDRPADPPPVHPLPDAAAPPAPGWRWLTACGVAALLALHWTIGTTALRDKCTTSDEIAHVTAGCAYWKWNDYRLQPENGNLPQRWHSIPAVLSGVSLPGPDSPGWQTSDVWQVGRSFFYDQGNDSRMLLAQGRAMAALFSVATCLLVFCWSRRLFGSRGAWLSLLLATLCPTMLAHGPLMTSDMCLTFFLLASTWAVWELLFEITLLRLAGGMLAIGGLFLAKMSAPLILAVAGVLVVVRLFIRRPLSIRGTGLWPALELKSTLQKLAAALSVTFVCGLFAFTAVWAAYGFRYWAFTEGPLTDATFYRLGNMETACRFSGTPGRILAALAEHHVLPEGYLFGSAYVLCHQRRCAFLNGEYSITGWRHYFLYCFAVKTPLALFGILALAAFTVARYSERPLWRFPAAGQPLPLPVSLIHLTPLIVLFVIYWATAIQTTLNIGYRHILPTYPVLYVLAGAAGLWLTWERRTLALAVAGLYGLFAADSLAAYPNYIAYFNPLVPRERAHEHLVDSNLDWGQDLPGLAHWLQTHNSGPGGQRVYLDYFGNGRPAYEAIQAVALPPPVVVTKEFQFRPGLYCISATRLMAVYAEAPGHWNKAYEERYQARRAFLTQCRQAEPSKSACEEIASARSALTYGQYLRLLAFLRHRRPDDNVGHSILIFRLTQPEIDQALNGPPAELDAQPWMPQRLKHL